MRVIFAARPIEEYCNLYFSKRNVTAKYFRNTKTTIQFKKLDAFKNRAHFSAKVPNGIVLGSS